MDMRRGNLVALAILLASTAGAIATLRAIAREPRFWGAQEALYVSSPRVLRRLSLGYTGLLADIYWTRAVQYFGEQHHADSSDFKVLPPLLEVATQLDPRLLPPSQLGS